MDSSDRRSRGQQMFRKVTLTEPPPPGSAFTEFTLDSVFAEVWSRPGLTWKERRWISLTAAAMTGSPVAIKSHVYSALKSGDITPAEMEEFLIHFAHYGGWPRAAIVQIEIRTALAEIKSSKQGKG